MVEGTSSLRGQQARAITSIYSEQASNSGIEMDRPRVGAELIILKVWRSD